MASMTISMSKLGPKGAKTHRNLASFLLRGTGGFISVELGKFPYPFLEILFRSNAIAQVNRLGLVAYKLHGNGTGHASALQVPYSRPPEVVDQLIGAARFSGRNIPS